MPRTLTPEDIYKFRKHGDAHISPDGSRVLFVAAQADKKEDGELTNIWMVDTEGGKPKKLTASGKDRFPRWSPDGKRFAFVSDRSGKAQIWIMEAEGGEPWLAKTEQSVMGPPVWSPDGRFIVFVSRAFTKSYTWVPYPGAPDWDRKRAEDQAKQALLDKHVPEGKDNSAHERISDVKVINRFTYRFDGVGYLGDLRSHIFVVSVPDAQPESGEIEGNVRRLTCGDYDHVEPRFSPDGKYLVITALRCDDADYMEKQDLWLVEVSTGRMIQILDGKGYIRCPVWSPDGSKIAFVGTDGSYGSSTSASLWVLEVEDFLHRLEAGEVFSLPAPLCLADAHNVTQDLDRPVGDHVSSDVSYIGEDLPFAWKDEESLLLLVCDKGATGLWEAVLNAETGKYEVECLWHDPLRNVLGLRVGGGKTILQVGSPSETDSLYMFNFDEKDSALTELFESNLWLKEVDLGCCERFTYKGDEGWDIDGWLIYPAGYEKGKKYPTVFFIHGGPHGTYGSAFMFQCQIFASKGYAVVYVNPRGSESYGQKFAYACVGDWGGSDFKDIMAAVDHVVDMGVGDPDRLFVTGWSYGGFMTSWIVTQTNRFKAAIAGAIISDRYSMYGTTDIPLFMEHHCGGFPWQIRDKYFERSAIAYVENVETPIMFIHGEGDLRCPISQSEEFYLSLKRLHKTAVMVRYPGEFHGFTTPSHKFDRFERMLAWFDYYDANH